MTNTSEIFDTNNQICWWPDVQKPRKNGWHIPLAGIVLANTRPYSENIAE